MGCISYYRHEKTWETGLSHSRLQQVPENSVSFWLLNQDLILNQIMTSIIKIMFAHLKTNYPCVASCSMCFHTCKETILFSSWLKCSLWLPHSAVWCLQLIVSLIIWIASCDMSIYLLPWLNVKPCMSIEGWGACMCVATGQKPQRWRCSMQHHTGE